MAVTSFGTPALAHATSGTVTATWGASQNRTAGNVLVAAVAAGAATSVSALTASSGWTQAAYSPNAATAHALSAFYYKVAAGSDAAPTFGATLSGTGAMTATLFELAAGNCIVPVDAAGTYASGSTAGTLSSITVSTSSNVNLAGEYALACFAQEATAATNTWNPGGGWSNAANDGTFSSVLHSAVDYLAAPTAGTIASETGHWTTDTTAYGAACAITAMAWTPGLEVYANTPSGTVTAGATDAPAAGTAELVTSSWTGFPTASPTLSPPTYLTMSDPAATSELLTTISTATGTVIRGTENTTPVTHASDWTAWQVEGPGGLGSFPQVHNVRSVLYSGGAKGDGVTDDTLAIQAAITSCINAGGGVVYLPEGTYKVTSTVTANVNDTTVLIRGAGRWATIIASHVGASTDTLRMYDSSNFSTRTQHGSGILGLTVDGTNAGGGATGLHLGDILQFEIDASIQNFSASSASIGVYFANAYYWMEQLHGYLCVLVCYNSVVFDCTSVGGSAGAYTSTGSFERCNLTIWLDTGDNQYNGVTFQNGTYVVNGELRVFGNMASGPDTTTAACLMLTGATPAGHPESVESNVSNSFLDVGVECDDNYTYKPQTVNIGGSNYIGSCLGNLNFGAAGNNFAAGTGAGNIGLIGVSSGDPGITANYFQQPITASAGYGIGQYQNTTSLATGGTISTSGVGYVPGTSSAAATGLILQSGTYDGQVIAVLNTNATTGRTWTFAAAATSHVANGTASTIAIETARTYIWANNTGLWYQST